MAEESKESKLVTIGGLYKLFQNKKDNDPIIVQIVNVKSKVYIHIGTIQCYNFYAHFVLSKECINKLDEGNHLKIKKYKIINSYKWKSKKIRILDAEYIETSHKLPDAPKGWILMKGQLPSKCQALIALYGQLGCGDYIRKLPALSICAPQYNTFIDLTTGLSCFDLLCVYNELTLISIMII